MGDLLKKKNKSEKNMLEQETNSITPEKAFDRQRLFTGVEEEEKSNVQPKKTTGTRIEVDVLSDLKALKTIDKADSVSEVIQTLIFSREKAMTKEEKREYDLLRKIIK